MRINSVIIILREVLEAALIVSVLMALCQMLQISRRRLIPALMLGGLLAVLYAVNINTISMLFEGVGQEIVNTGLYLFIFSCLLVLIVAIGKRSANKTIVLAISGCIAAALVREGTEIIIYLHGFWSDPGLMRSVIVGSFIGAGIGFSIGVFFYYLIVSLVPTNGLRFSIGVLILIGGGMISQATQLLIQADIIPSQAPLWNSSAWINESSLIGQLLYALVGYEASPTPIQAACYALSIIIATTLAIKSLRTSQLNTQLLKA